MNYLLLSGVAVCAIAGALAAAPKKMDLIGVIFVGAVTALGGGTARDLLLGTRVFWVESPIWVLVSVAASLVTYAAARRIRFRMGLLLVLDAFGLAMFSVVGCEKALQLHTSFVVVVMMGVITGVAGGILRDLLCDEVPVVFRSGTLYATASFAGCLLLVGLLALGAGWHPASLTGVVGTLAIRLAALRWHITLPVFVVRD